jgi:hypothetical protein
METSSNWFGIYWAAWLVALMVFFWGSLWYLSSGRRRDKDPLGISPRQFAMHAKLSPDEVKRRLSGAVEPVVFLRFSLNSEAYEGQWLAADRFELHRLIGRNAWYVYVEIFPYLQDTTLMKVTLKTSLLGLVPLVLFFLNPILLGILASAIPMGREINVIDLGPLILMPLIFCGIPGSFLAISGVLVYVFTLSRETAKVRAFLERVLGI